MTHDELTDANSRLLGNGERIEAGDYAQEEDGVWHELSHLDFMEGEPMDGEQFPPVRRLLETPNTVFTTGAQRTAQEGRGRFDLIPYEAMLALARRLELGSAIYGDRNWEKGMPLSRYLSSLRRHAMQIGYDFSEDHVGAVLFNAAAFVATAERIKAGILPGALDDIGYWLRQEPAAPAGNGYLNESPQTPSTVIHQIP